MPCLLRSAYQCSNMEVPQMKTHKMLQDSGLYPHWVSLSIMESYPDVQG